MGHWPDTDFIFFFIELFFPNWSWPFPLFRRKQDVLKKREKTATMTFSWKRKRCYFLNIINLITSCLKKKRLERLQIEEGRLDLVELVPRGGADARPWIKRVKMSSTILTVKHQSTREKNAWPSVQGTIKYNIWKSVFSFCTYLSYGWS